MIDILVPVLGRPQNVQPLVDSIRANTTEPHTITFLCSDGDGVQREAVREAMVANHPARIFSVDTGRPAGGGDYAMKINDGFHMSQKMRREVGLPDSEWVFMAADDIRFEPRWDTTALKAAGDMFHVVGTNDLANSQVQRGLFGTHCLIRRSYITEHGGTADNITGSVLYEGYDHNFVDRELCHLAQHRGVFVSARHSRVRHYHPLWRTAKSDPTYVKALARFREDQQLFLTRAHLWDHEVLSEHERKAAA